MLASVAVCAMMVGGLIYPESEIMSIPLKDDFSGRTSIQDMEWRERVKRVPLPRVVTVDDRPQAGDDTRMRDRRTPVPPTDPNAPRGRMPVMPTAPTQAGDLPGQRPTSNMPSQPGGGYAPTAPSDDPYANMSVPGRKPVAGYGGRGVPTSPTMPRAGKLTASNPMTNPSAGGGSKPYSDYRPPSGYTPWNELNQRTNNGTINPYTQYVRPQMDQQNFNAHTREQINGVQTLQRGYGAETPGMEVPMGGAGMANPNTFQNYKGYYPTNP